jgi:hypothetical protein
MEIINTSLRYLLIYPDSSNVTDPAKAYHTWTTTARGKFFFAFSSWIIFNLGNKNKAENLTRTIWVSCLSHFLLLLLLQDSFVMVLAPGYAHLLAI